MPEVYCVKCKAKREAIDTKKVTMKKTGRPGGGRVASRGDLSTTQPKSYPQQGCARSASLSRQMNGEPTDAATR